MWDGHQDLDGLPSSSSSLAQFGSSSTSTAAMPTIMAWSEDDNRHSDSQHQQHRPKKLKAPRTSLACTKVRCEGGNEKEGVPCQRCASMNVPCEYLEKPVKKQPPSKAYVEALEKRLEAMEAALNSMANNASSYPNNGGGSGSGLKSRANSILTNSNKASPPSHHQSPSPRSAHRDSPSTHDNGGGDSPFDNLERVTDRMDELDIVEDRFLGRSSNLQIAQLLHDSTAHESLLPKMPKGKTDAISVVEATMQDEHTARGRESPMPPLDLAAKLIDAYFTNINDKTVPLLHRPSFKRSVQARLYETDLTFRGLYLMVCAHGARFVRDDRIKLPTHPQYSQKSVEYARGHEYFRGALMNCSMPFLPATLYDIQALLLCALYLLGAGGGMGSWMLVGYALRRSIDVGLHRENRPIWRMSPLENELRRRAFFLLLFFDHHLSSQLGRPEAVSDDQYDLSEPLVIDDETLDRWDLERGAEPPPSSSSSSSTNRGNSPSVLQGLISLIRITRISGFAMKKLYSTKPIENVAEATNAISELDLALTNWLESVPSFLRWKQGAADKTWIPMSFYLYSAYYNCQLLIHRDFISPRRSALTTYPSLAICANAARSLAHMLDDVSKNETIKLVIPVVMGTALTASLVLMFNGLIQMQQSNRMSQSSVDDVRKCLTCLRSLSSTVYSAEQMYKALLPLCDALSNTTATKKRGHGTGDETPMSSSTTSSPPNCLGSNNPNIGPNEHGGGSTTSYSAGNSSNNNEDGPRARKLPMTTNDLSLPTFRGRPNFTPAPVYAYSDATPASMSSNFTNTQGPFDNALQNPSALGPHAMPSMSMPPYTNAPSSFAMASAPDSTMMPPSDGSLQDLFLSGLNSANASAWTDLLLSGGALSASGSGPTMTTTGPSSMTNLSRSLAAAQHQFNQQQQQQQQQQRQQQQQQQQQQQPQQQKTPLASQQGSVAGFDWNSMSAPTSSSTTDAPSSSSSSFWPNDTQVAGAYATAVPLGTEPTNQRHHQRTPSANFLTSTGLQQQVGSPPAFGAFDDFDFNAILGTVTQAPWILQPDQDPQSEQ